MRHNCTQECSTAWQWRWSPLLQNFACLQFGDRYKSFYNFTVELCVGAFQQALTRFCMGKPFSVAAI